MKGLVVGCSMACGYCCVLDTAKISQSWPNRLMQYIGIEDVYNKSAPGMSNKRITETIVKFVEESGIPPSELFVIISVTTDYRTSLDTASGFTIDVNRGTHMSGPGANVACKLRDVDADVSQRHFTDNGVPDYVQDSFDIPAITHAYEKNYVLPSNTETAAYMTYISSYLKEKQIKHLLINAASVKFTDIITSNKINSISFKDFAMPPQAADKLHPSLPQNVEFFNLIKDQVRERYDFRN